MNHSENQVPFDKESIQRKNNEDYLRLYADVQEMKAELRHGKLSPEAKLDLEKKISETQQALTLLRESVKALSKRDTLVVADEIHPLEIEIIDTETFYHDQHLEKLRELEELQKERELLFDLLPENNLPTALKQIEDRIQKAKEAADAAHEKYKQSQQRH